MRRAILTLGGALLVVLACLAAMALALAHGWQRDWIRDEVEARLEKALEQPVTIDSIEGVLYQKPMLRGVRVGDPNEPLIQLDRVGISLGRVRWGAAPRVELRVLEFIGARLDVARLVSSEGPWQQATTARSDEAGEGEESWISFQVDSVRLEDCSLMLRLEGLRASLIRVEASAEDVELAQTLDVGGARVSFSVSRGSGSAEPWLVGSAEGGLHDGAWTLEAVDATGPVLTLAARGNGNAGAITATTAILNVVSLEALGRELLEEPPPATGRVRIDLELARDPDRDWPHGTAKVEAERIAWGAQPLGDLELVLHSEQDGELVIDSFEMLDEDLRFVAEPGATVFISPDVTRIDDLRLHQVDSPGTLAVAAVIPRLKGGEEQSIATQTATRLSVTGTNWPLESLAPFFAERDIELAGRLETRLSLVGGAEGWQLAGEAHLGALRVESGDLHLRDGEFDLVIEGPASNPKLDFRGRAEKVDLAGTPLGLLATEGRLRDRTLRFERLSLSDGFAPIELVPGSELTLSDSGLVYFRDFALVEGGQKILLAGGIGSDRADRFSIELAPLDVGRTVDLLRSLDLFELDSPVSGRITGGLVWDGARANPDLSGEWVWAEPMLGEIGFEAIEGHVETLGASAMLRSRWSRAGGAALDFEGEVPRERLLTGPLLLVEDSRTQIEATTDDFDLRAVASFLPEAISDLSGLVTARVSARGGKPEPQVTGSARLREGGVKLSALGGQAFAPIEGSLSFAGDRLVIDHLEVGTGEAGVTGAGTFFLEGLDPRRVDLRLDFRRYALDVSGLVRGVVSGPVELAGQVGALTLSGKIELDGVKAQIPDPEDSVVREIRIISSDGDLEPGSNSVKETTEPSPLDNLEVDMGVMLSRNSWARGRGAEVELQGSLEARKARQGILRLSGTVETLRGTYEVYGRRFRIERGAAVFDGGVEVDPVIDVRAVHRVRDVKIFAIIAGRLSEPTLRFESDPDLDETDIASYLLFGRPMSGHAGEEQVALDAVAAQIATGIALREFEQMFGGALPVDLIDLRVDGSGDATEVRAGVGKYVGERLFLYYERGFGDEPTDEFRAEYELTPSWSVESTATAEGETAGDLVFEIDY